MNKIQIIQVLTRDQRHRSPEKMPHAIGGSLDDLVRERMTGLVEEPDITSRVGQRLEDRFDGKTIGGYRIRVISETITSHGSKSLEKPMGTGLYFAIEIENAQGVGRRLVRSVPSHELDYQERISRLVVRKVRD